MLGLYDAASLAQEMLELDVTLSVNKTKMIPRFLQQQKGKFISQ